MRNPNSGRSEERGQTQYRGGQSEYRGGPSRLGGRGGSGGQSNSAGQGHPTDAGHNHAGRQSWEERAGEFAGKGPKGYQKSDDRIREDVCDRLTGDCCVDPSDVEVTVSAGEVTLAGTVAHRGHKRDIEEICGNCAGVKDVHNKLRIK